MARRKREELKLPLIGTNLEGDQAEQQREDQAIAEHDNKPEIMRLLSINVAKAALLVASAKQAYIEIMSTRFSETKLSERLRRTNPFLLRIRGVETVEGWATNQIQSTLFASEEEAVGHLLEEIAMICHPNATKPRFPEHFDYQVEEGKKVDYYQVKMSWDAMNFSGRSKLSDRIGELAKIYKDEGKEFQAFFAPCYGKPTESRPPGQKYITLRSRDLWMRVGDGDVDFDFKVGEVCSLLCAEARVTVEKTLIPVMMKVLIESAEPEIGDGAGMIDYRKLFRRINK